MAILRVSAWVDPHLLQDASILTARATLSATSRSSSPSAGKPMWRQLWQGMPQRLADHTGWARLGGRVLVS